MMGRGGCKSHLPILVVIIQLQTIYSADYKSDIMLVSFSTLLWGHCFSCVFGVADIAPLVQAAG